MTVIAIEVEGEIRAMTANSFTSLSLDPPLVLFCLGKDTKAGQPYPLGARLLDQHPARGPARPLVLLRGWMGAGRAPASVLVHRRGKAVRGSTAASPRLDAAPTRIHEGGDHWIVVGEVVATYRAEDAGEPLVFFGGKYVGLQT